MARRFVRDSKYRHVYGQAFPRDQTFEGLRFTKSCLDCSFSAVNPKFLAISVDSSGGGAFIVVKVDKAGRLEKQPKVNAHSSDVLDLAFDPFNDNILASCSEDASVKLWEIPDEGFTTEVSEPLMDLRGHQRKVVQLLWHPTAANVLLSASHDPSIVIWNLEDGTAAYTFNSIHPDIIYNVSWNFNGSAFATACKDKKVRVVNARTGEVTKEFLAHEGTKPIRVCYIHDQDRLVTTGFTKMSERSVTLWDLNDTSKPLSVERLDHSNGTLFPFYDADTKVLFVIGKGDAIIRYFEIDNEEPYLHFLTMYQSSESQRAVCIMPKRGVNIHQCEIFRLYKLLNKGVCEPISFIVPRKSDLFQEDIYPDTPGYEAALTATEWFSGQDANPKYVSLKESFDANKTTSTVNLKQSGIGAKKSSSVASTPKHAPASQSGAAVTPVHADTASLKAEVAGLSSLTEAQNRRIASLEEKLSRLEEMERRLAALEHAQCSRTVPDGADADCTDPQEAGAEPEM